jgi:adenine-specific DNA methylase
MLEELKRSLKRTSLKRFIMFEPKATTKFNVNDLIQIIPGYLGNKTEILNEIRELTCSLADKGSLVLDLFGGSNVVGCSLKDNFVILSNDIQKYSHIIAKVLLEDIPTKVFERLNENRIFNDYYEENYKNLKLIFSDALQREEEILNKRNIQAFRTFSIRTPNYNHIPKTVAKEFENKLNLFSEDYVKSFRKNKKKTPYSLFTLFFMNSYFGIEQCLEIDSIRYAIDNISKLPLEKDYEKLVYLVCLMFALYYSVSSVGGHFAQPQKLNGDDAVLKLINKHSISIKEVFTLKLHEIKKKLVKPSYKNKAFNLDYKELFDKGKHPEIYDLIKDVSVVYVDPPYTIDHYSRFYHILETLVNYDYPESIGVGRYRKDRLQSNFCIKSKVAQEFDTMLGLLSQTNAKVIISYTDTYRALLTSEQILDICRKHYRNVELAKRIKHDYSSLGQNSTNGGNELLFLCKK